MEEYVHGDEIKVTKKSIYTDLGVKYSADENCMFHDDEIKATPKSIYPDLGVKYSAVQNRTCTSDEIKSSKQHLIRFWCLDIQQKLSNRLTQCILNS